MKFVLLEFCEDNSCGIGESDWIVHKNNYSLDDNFDKSHEVLVKWPKQKDYVKWSNKLGKLSLHPDCEMDTYAARILKFSGKF
jgi:hypothetical protein